MIKLGKIGVTLICDICGEEIDGFFDFENAVAHKKETGWKSEKYRGEWQDICTNVRRDKMGRLIDADDLIGVIQYNTNYKPNKSAIMADELIRYINSQPPAYDVDKVVEQLETGLEEILYDRCYSNDYDMGMKEVNALLDKVMKGAVKDEEEEVQGISKKLAEWQKSDADKERYTVELYNRARKAEEKADYREREAKKWCAKLGEIRLLIGEQN